MRPGHHADVCICRENQNQARAELEARAKINLKALGTVGSYALTAVSLLSFLPSLFGSQSTTNNNKRFTDTPELRALFAE